MPSFLINSDNINDDELVISGEESHHIQRVLRLGKGDGLTLLDGEGYRYEARITQQDAHQMTVAILSKESVSAPNIDITLIQCLPRLDKMDLIVQKAVELGVSRIIPVLSQRCKSIQGTRLSGKQQRWQRIAAQATKQCGQAHLPVVKKVQKLSDILAWDWENFLAIVFWEDERSKNLKHLLRNVSSPEKIALLVGAEGGFTPHEISLAQSHGWQVVGLGSRILRLETAAIVGLGIIQYELGDLST